MTSSRRLLLVISRERSALIQQIRGNTDRDLDEKAVGITLSWAEKKSRHPAVSACSAEEKAC